MYNGGWIVFMMPTEKTYMLLHVYKKNIVWKAFTSTIYEISVVFSRTMVIHSMVLIPTVWIKIPLINNGTIFKKFTKKNIEFLKYEYQINPENPCFQYHYSAWVVLKKVKLEWSYLLFWIYIDCLRHIICCTWYTHHFIFLTNVVLIMFSQIIIRTLYSI